MYGVVKIAVRVCVPIMAEEMVFALFDEGFVLGIVLEPVWHTVEIRVVKADSWVSLNYGPLLGINIYNYIMAPVNVGYQHATLILGAPSIHCFQGVWMQRLHQAMIKEKAKCRKQSLWRVGLDHTSFRI